MKKYTKDSYIEVTGPECDFDDWGDEFPVYQAGVCFGEYDPDPSTWERFDSYEDAFDWAEQLERRTGLSVA